MGPLPQFNESWARRYSSGTWRLLCPFEKVPRKTRFPFSFDEATSGLTSASLGNADQRPPALSSSLSTPACLGLFLPPPSSSHYSEDQSAPSDDQLLSPSQLEMDSIPSVPYSNEVRNYAETTPYQLQAELDDASIVSEDPKYGCESSCLYCGQPCVRSKFGHVFHQCPEHYRWWRMHKR